MPYRILLLSLIISSLLFPQESLTTFVNPFIGTANESPLNFGFLTLLPKSFLCNIWLTAGHAKVGWLHGGMKNFY